MKKILVFTIDDKYVEPFSAAIESFSDQHDVSEYRIGLIYSNICEKKLRKLRIQCDKLGLDLDERIIDDEFLDIKVGYHFNSVIFYRILIPEIYSQYEIVLYLDSDILFVGSIDELYTVPLVKRGVDLAAISKSDVTGIPKHLVGKVNSYFASGLLMFNVKKCLVNNLYGKVKQFLINEEYDMPDQDALNCSVENWMPVNKKYGMETSFFEHDDVVTQELKDAQNKPHIIQFSGYSKPWNSRNKHPYKALYWEYLRRTPFSRPFATDSTITEKIKYILKFGFRCMIVKFNYLYFSIIKI